MAPRSYRCCDVSPNRVQKFFFLRSIRGFFLVKKYQLSLKLTAPQSDLLTSLLILTQLNFSFLLSFHTLRNFCSEGQSLKNQTTNDFHDSNVLLEKQKEKEIASLLFSHFHSI